MMFTFAAFLVAAVALCVLSPLVAVAVGGISEVAAATKKRLGVGWRRLRQREWAKRRRVSVKNARLNSQIATLKQCNISRGAGVGTMEDCVFAAAIATSPSMAQRMLRRVLGHFARITISDNGVALMSDSVLGFLQKRNLLDFERFIAPPGTLVVVVKYDESPQHTYDKHAGGARSRSVLATKIFAARVDPAQNAWVEIELLCELRLLGRCDCLGIFGGLMSHLDGVVRLLANRRGFSTLVTVADSAATNRKLQLDKLAVVQTSGRLEASHCGMGWRALGLGVRRWRDQFFRVQTLSARTY
eukprot:GEMP01072048.1.p1 GENE.GEMP01072048.1~~GEMP01072048.1.p1  ORF type:complete len:301 (+),score=44.04 GEMP01072048.1:77-979(+)